jgi:integrase
MNYRFEGKQQTLAFGAYPAVSLADARGKREEAKKLLANGVDPGALKKELAAVRKAEEIKAALTFETVAREWLEKQSSTWANSHLYDTTRKLEKNVFPKIGNRPISEIGLTEALDCLRKVEARGIGETAKRCKIIMGQVFRYAAACGWRTDDPTALLKGALAPVKSTEFPAITDPKELAGLLRVIEVYSGSPIVRAALCFGALVVLRPVELRYGTWDEIDFEAKQWNIPGPRMKLKKDHIVPLSRQAVDILRELQPITGASRYIFPNGRSLSKPLSENGVTAALAYLGYKGRHCGHGWRATFRTIGDEILRVRVDLLEHQLAHAVKDPNGTSYNRTKFLDDRREMMQTWADYLDELKQGESK